MRFGIPQSKDFNRAVNLLSCHLGCKPDKHCYLSIDDLTVIDLAVGVTHTVQMSLKKKKIKLKLHLELCITEVKPDTSTQQTPVRNTGCICSLKEEQRKN